MTRSIYRRLTGAALGATALCALALPASADQVFADDVIVDGSLCVGVDCVNGESFGFDTIRLKENNLRIKAQDTSSSGSFPTVDWQITFNDSANGGANKFSIDDIDTGRTPLTILSGARSNSIFVNASSRVGFGTASPVTDLHVVNGNTPTLRLQQDGSSGFTAQTFDIAANETNFFIRDATNGSTLPFKIIPAAPNNALVVAANGNVGMGAGTSPDAALHVERSGATDSSMLIESGTGDASFVLKQSGTAPAQWEFRSQASSGRLNVGIVGGNTPLKIDDLANNNLLRLGLDGAPDVVSVTGELQVNNTALSVPDYVFAPEYTLRSLSEVRAFIEENSHLPDVPSAAMIARDGVGVTTMQMALLKKVEELTLYTLAQEDRIATLTAKIESMETAD